MADREGKNDLKNAKQYGYAGPSLLTDGHCRYSYLSGLVPFLYLLLVAEILYLRVHGRTADHDVQLEKAHELLTHNRYRIAIVDRY